MCPMYNARPSFLICLVFGAKSPIIGCMTSLLRMLSLATAACAYHQ